jgi:hypothetical protein
MRLFSGPVDFTAHPAVRTIISAESTNITAVSGLPQSQEPLPVPVYIGGVLIIFLFVAYLVGGSCCRSRREKLLATRLQQIATLERIWKMTPGR